MFVPEKDERLNHIVANAGLYTFLSYFFVVLFLMIVRGFVSWPLLSNPDFLLVMPWLLSGMIFMGLHIKGGYYSAIREENSSSRNQLLTARVEVLLTALGAGALWFLDKRLDLISDGQSTLGKDLTDSAIFALMLGVFHWFLHARKSRKSATTNQEG